jgi:hypothetical protein
MSFFRAIYPNFSRQDGYTYAFQSIIYQYDKNVTDGVSIYARRNRPLRECRSLPPKPPANLDI